MLRALLFLAALASPAVAAQSPCTSGTATLGGVSYACDGVDLLARIPAGTDGPLRAAGLNDIWGWTDPQDGTEYALVGTRNGTVFVDVSTPTAPRVLGRMASTNDFETTWRDIKVYRDHAFVGSEATNHGIQVFDLTRLRGLSADDARAFEPDARYTGVASSHNVVINEETGFLYAVGAVSVGPNLPASCDARGFHAVDIQTPTSPTFAGCFSDAANETGPRSPGYTHDAQCVVYRGPDADHQGREICFGANEDVVSIFDASDKSAVTLLSQIAYPNSAYTHQGWLTDDQRFFIANDELDESRSVSEGLTPDQRTLVFDVSDLDNPDFSFQYNSGLPTIDHNLYVVGRYAYEANYESGLRILDLDGIQQGVIREAAFFDTYPQSTTAQFNGMWSVYPYFQSGTVVVSDINNGLFVLRPDAQFTTGVVVCDCGGLEVALSPPAPHPATGTTTLTLTTAAAVDVSARLYDVAGRELAVLFEGRTDAGGRLPLVVDASDLATGVYVVRVTGETFAVSGRLTVVR